MSSAPVRELGHEATHITPLKPQFRYSQKTTIQSTLWDHVTFSLDRCLWWWIIKMKHWWSLMWVCVGWWSSSERPVVCNTMCVCKRDHVCFVDKRWVRLWPCVFRIHRFPWQISKDKVRRVLREAIKIWIDVTPLTFTEVINQEADIVIDFAR